MPTKNFEQTVQFIGAQTPHGPRWWPIVEVTIIPPIGNPVSLSLLFDTGADVTTLRADCYPFLGLSRWDEGQLESSVGLGGIVNVYRYTATLEIWGKTIEDCPINLAPLQPNDLFSGLLGREVVFDQFGFGFWESARELYVTMNP